MKPLRPRTEHESAEKQVFGAIDIGLMPLIFANIECQWL
jgi:hypothetical protein